MSTTQIVLLISTILLFSIGLWPIALLTAVGMIAIALHKKEEKKKAESEKIERLEKELEALKRKEHIKEIVTESDKKRGH